MLWPAAAAVSLAIAVGGKDVTLLGLALLACGTMSGYGLDRYIDRRHLDSPIIRRGLRWAILISSIIAFALACTAVWRFEVCVVLGVLTGFYVPLKRYIPKNMLTVPAWTIAVCALPFATAPDWSGQYTASALAVALIMLANTVLCDVPNVEEDREAKVRAFAARYGAEAGAVFACLAAIFGMVAAIGFDHVGLAVTAACLIPLAMVLGRNPIQHRARQAVDEVIVYLPGPITLLVMGWHWLR